MRQFKRVSVRVALLALGVSCFSSVSMADTVICPTISAATIASLGGSCIFGGTLFSNISIATSTESLTAPTGAIDPNQVSLQFTSAGSNLAVVTLTNATPSNWALTGTQQFNLILTYTMSGGPWFSGFGNDMIASATSGSSGAGAVSFDKAAQWGTTTNALPTLSLAMTSNPVTDFVPSGSDPAPPLSSVNITDNIQVHATNASATLVSASNQLVVPEPMTSTLLGSGLLAVGFFLRRKNRG